MENIIYQERHRIAGELHDGIAQQITHVLHKIEYIQRLWGTDCPEALRAELQSMSYILKDSLDEVRNMISALLQQKTDGAINSGTSGTTPSGTSGAINCADAMNRVPMDTRNKLREENKSPLIQFIQETLANIWKHAHATEVDIHLHLSENRLTVEVKDNGLGFQPEQFCKDEGQNAFPDHFGLVLMQSRIKDVGGLWELQSRPGEGTTVRANFPIA